MLSSNAESAKRAQKSPPANPLQKAQVAYTQGDFDDAIKNYRAYLRANRGDFNAWNMLGTAYYHTGQVNLALEYLKYAAPRTTQRAHNFFYQGLCQLALGRQRTAKQKFQSAAYFNDEYGVKAAFELATLEYNARQKDAAVYWTTFYQQKFASGPHIKAINEMATNLREGKFGPPVPGNEKVERDEALFKYHSWSLSQRPHYWFAQLGYRYANGTEQNPDLRKGVVTSPNEDQALLINGGVGIGPVRKDQYSTWAGYHYNQSWVTDSGRLADYLESPTDIEYLPYRADIMERRHQLLGEVSADIAPYGSVGAFAKVEFARVGSSYFPSPEEQDLRKVFRMSDSTLLVPWAQISYLQRYQTSLHLYMRKELNDDIPEYSNKTYNLFDEGDKAISLGINQRANFPEYKLWANLAIFRYEFIYNDTWFDFTRLGFTASAEYEFYRGLFVHGLIGTYTDSYQVPRLKQVACSYLPADNPASNDSGVPLNCMRKDTGLIYQGGIYWNYNDFYRLSGLVTFTENRNPQQKIFDRTKLGFLGMATIAFPESRKVIERTDRYTDTIGYKDAD